LDSNRFTVLVAAWIGFAGSIAWLPAQDPAGKLVAMRGQVEVRRTDWTPAVLNQELLEGDTVRTLQNSRAVVLLTDETQLKLNAETVLQLAAARKNSNVVTRIATAAARTEQSLMNLGSGQVYVRNRKTPASLRVTTPAVTAAIRGTEFDLLVHADGETIATVLEGSIDYQNEFGAIVVNSGEQGRARVGEPPTKTVILNPEDAVQWTFFYSVSVSGLDFPFRYRTRQDAQTAAAAATDALDRAYALHDAGETAAALEALAVQTSPQAQELRGWLLLESNRVAEAQSALLAAGDTPRARLGRSLSHLRVNEFDQALALVEDPGGDELLVFQKAFLLSLLGDAAGASTLRASLPDSGPAGARRQALEAIELLTRNHKDEALQIAQRATAANPDSPAAWVALSRVQQAFFQLEEATASARRALALAPAYVEARVQYARLLFGAGLNAQAERTLVAALADAPEDAGVHTLMGFIRLARGKTEEARTAFEKAISLDSTLADPRLGLGLVRMRRGETFDATAELLFAATLEPRLSLYQSYLAKAFYELREFEQAFTALSVATELDPRDPTPHLYAGIFEDDLNRPGRAVRSYQESIRLNDFRAVYRSRFLLDQDRAARNINLARAYNRLGLAEWGNSEALKSELDDPANSSAHIFLANTFLNLPGRTLLAGSESLLARLLLPVNANSFNSFNDYSTLFELPRAYWTLFGAYGSFNTANAGLLATGGTSRLAYRMALSWDRTSGFRPFNDDLKQYTGDVSAKFALTPESDILVSYSNQQAREGDHGSPVLVNELNDPNLRSTSRFQRAELGYHQRFRPGSELAVVVSAREFEQVIDDPDRLRRPIFGGQVILFGLRQSLRRPSIDLQATHLLDLGRLQLRYGFDWFEGRTRSWDVLRFIFPGDEQYTFQEFDFTRNRIRYKTIFARSDFRLLPNLTLIAGLNRDWSNDDNRSDGSQNPTARWNPQAGILFTPFSGTTLRAAYFQNLQTHFGERLAPTHVLGFPLGQNESEMSHSTTVNLGWDQYVGRLGFLRTAAYWRDRRTPALDFTEQPTRFEGHAYGGRITWNQFLTEQLTLVPDYAVTRNLDLFGRRHDHEVSLGLRYVHPRGVYTTLRENYLRQTGLLGPLRTHVKVFTTDLELAWEFPRKWGLAVFSVRNLWDRKYEFLVDPLALDPRIPGRQADFSLRFNF
jgi:Flp pilus assembly protein TadD